MEFYIGAKETVNELQHTPFYDDRDKATAIITVQTTPPSELIRDTLIALCDMVNQFAYSTTFCRCDAICDGGLSALESAFWVLGQHGCKINSNGTIQRHNLQKFEESLGKERRK